MLSGKEERVLVAADTFWSLSSGRSGQSHCKGPQRSGAIGIPASSLEVFRVPFSLSPCLVAPPRACSGLTGDMDIGGFSVSPRLAALSEMESASLLF